MLVAEGVVDVYPRLGSNCEWDTAAGQCIVEVAGGLVVDWNFQPLQYNTRQTMESVSFLALGDPQYGGRISCQSKIKIVPIPGKPNFGCNLRQVFMLTNYHMPLLFYGQAGLGIKEFALAFADFLLGNKSKHLRLIQIFIN